MTLNGIMKELWIESPRELTAIAGWPTAKKIGKVDVDMGDTDCQVPDAASYILEFRQGAAIAPKRKTTRC